MCMPFLNGLPASKFKKASCLHESTVGPPDIKKFGSKIKIQKASIPTNKQGWKSYHGTILLWEIYKDIHRRGC